MLYVAFALLGSGCLGGCAWMGRRDAGTDNAAGPALQTGFASWYGPGFQGRRTASGERFDMNALTAAHRSLPFGTLVQVRANRTGNTVVVRINDRGPGKAERVIDLSKAAAQALGMLEQGVEQVELRQIRSPGI